MNMCMYGLSFRFKFVFEANKSAFKGINLTLTFGMVRMSVEFSDSPKSFGLQIFIKGKNSSIFCLNKGQQSEISSSKYENESEFEQCVLQVANIEVIKSVTGMARCE